MAQVGEENTKGSLDKIKKQLNAASGSVLLQGSLLKRSETLRKWNQRWFMLDPSTGRLEYRFQRGDATPRGLISFDADSTITVSPLNIQGERKYDGCCFYIGTPQKKEYFLCAETPSSARAWVATIRAAALVLKAHKEAVNSLSGNGRAKLGTVAAVVAAANATAREAVKDLQMSFRPSAIFQTPSQPAESDSMDNAAVLKETLRVKDEELNQLQRDLRARDFTIKELAERLSETADAAESAASAVHSIEKELRVALSEKEHLRNELVRAAQENKAAEERVLAAVKARELAYQEAHRWRVELGKARENGVILEAAVQRGQEHARHLKFTHEQELARLAQSQEPRAATTSQEAGVHEEGASGTGEPEKDSRVSSSSGLNNEPPPAASDISGQEAENFHPPTDLSDKPVQNKVSVAEDGSEHLAGIESPAEGVRPDPSDSVSGPATTQLDNSVSQAEMEEHEDVQ